MTVARSVLAKPSINDGFLILQPLQAIIYLNSGITFRVLKANLSVAPDQRLLWQYAAEGARVVASPAVHRELSLMIQWLEGQ